MTRPPPVPQFTNIPPSETWGLAFAPPGAAGSDKLLLAVAGGTANAVRLLDVGAKAEAATLGMPEAADKQRREKFVLSVAYSPGGCDEGPGGLVAAERCRLGRCAQLRRFARSLACCERPLVELAGLRRQQAAAPAWGQCQGCLLPGRCPCPTPEPLPAPCAPLAADGRRIAAGGMDGTVALFDAATGKLLHTLDGHFKPVRDLTFTPGGATCWRPWGPCSAAAAEVPCVCGLARCPWPVRRQASPVLNTGSLATRPSGKG